MCFAYTGRSSCLTSTKVCRIVTFPSYGCNNRFLVSTAFARNQSQSPKTSSQKEKLMSIKKFVLRTAGSSLAAILLLAAPRLGAETLSESERLQKLERAVEQLQKRNAELEQEVADS